MSKLNNVKFYIVGAFETPTLQYFPTHLQPIIAERIDQRFRRWSYVINDPYEISPCSPMGEFKSIECLFPVNSFLMLNKPAPMRKHSQLVALGANDFLISSSRIVVTFRLILLLIRRCRYNDKQYRRRIWITLCNSFE